MLLPLPHTSLSHGALSFGFFNIESSMLLLERLFFFAQDFCQAVRLLAAAEETGESGGERATFVEAQLNGWQIGQREVIGDLHGAIAGEDRSGFIGATYARFPAPQDPADFKQNPAEQLRPSEVQRMIRRHGQAAQIILGRDLREGLLRIGERGSTDPYVFSEALFARLVTYVDRGGPHGWRDGRQPSYVLEMMQRLDDRRSPLRPERG